MHICVDVFYTDELAIASGAVFEHWGDASSSDDLVVTSGNVQPYVPGKFYKRELGPICELIKEVSHDLETVVIDGFVWLNDTHTPGLGAYLYDALKQRVPVIGVAKNRFQNSHAAVEVLRGQSERPLFVTAAGIEREQAARAIRGMHGEYRIPTLLKYADRLGRDEAERQLGNM
ncbi:MAG: endonuclease V [Planctomycetota bacterium]|jgi:deoxyribonuclease V